MFGSSIEIWQTVKYNESEKINSAFHKKIRKNPFTSLVQWFVGKHAFVKILKNKLITIKNKFNLLKTNNK